jgi:hypothetical protein
MAKEETPDDRSGLDEVQITVVVVPGRIRAALTRFLARARVRRGLVLIALTAVVTAVAIIVVLSSGGRASRPLDSDALTTQFGLRSNCARLTIVSPDGAYTRIDLDHSGPCGTFGNQVTLVLHRVQGVWVRKFEASSWTCPISSLPQPVAIELQLCRLNRGITLKATPDSMALEP